MFRDKKAHHGHAMTSPSARRRLAAAIVAAPFLVLGVASRAQDPGHGYTTADIERGNQVYLLSCASCHGPNGDTVPGLNVFSGTFRRAATDQQLAALLRSGIPGTAMPPSSLTESEALQVVAYLRSAPAAATASKSAGPAGTVAAGRALYSTLDCATCHMIDGIGGFLGPDLSSVGITRRPDELERALTTPNADIRNGSRTVAITTANGASVTGRLLNQDTYSLQFIDAAGRLTSIRKDAVRRWEVMEASAMPNYAEKLNPQQLADLVSYLQGLNAPVRSGGVAGTARGGGPPRGGGAGAPPAGGRGAGAPPAGGRGAGEPPPGGPGAPIPPSGGPAGRGGTP
jgi:putative heme-binding domain-containing protein